MHNHNHNNNKKEKKKQNHKLLLTCSQYTNTHTHAYAHYTRQQLHPTHITLELLNHFFYNSLSLLLSIFFSLEYQNCSPALGKLTLHFISPSMLHSLLTPPESLSSGLLLTHTPGNGKLSLFFFLDGLLFFWSSLWCWAYAFLAYCR